MTTISLFEINLSIGKKLSKEQIVWKGTGGNCGTFKDHIITVARSSNIWGPYESYEKNPILTAVCSRNDNYIRCTGHCDMFQDEQDRWWGVCLGMRMRDSRFIMGRESFLVTFSHHFKTTIIESPKSGLDWLYIPGLVNYKDEHPYTRIWYDSGKRIVRFGVINNAKKISRGHEAKIENDIEELHLLIKYTKKQLVLQYMEEDGALETIGTVDTEELSNANFVGPIIGVFATSDSNCSPPVLFKSFRVDQ
ncbi:unnamed protein product [Aureobasidium pullulans]|nr:unnamed protein product [Aureobasidium pullulans]